MQGVVIESSNFNGADLSDVIADGSTVIAGGFLKTNLQGGVPDNIEWVNSNLRGALVSDYGVSEGRFCNTTQPNGTLSNAGCGGG